MTGIELLEASGGAVDGDGVLEVRVAARGHVAEVECRVNDLVVAVQRMHRPAGASRFLRQAREQVEDRLLFVAPIELVPGLHDYQVAADPAVVLVQGAGQPQGVAGGAQIPMQVADGDDPRGRSEPQRRRIRDSGDWR